MHDDILKEELEDCRVEIERLRAALEKLATGYHGGAIAQQIARAALEAQPAAPGGDNG